MLSFENEQFYLFELSNIFKPQLFYRLDYMFTSIDEELMSYETWDQDIDGPTPSKAIECTPQNWYTQYRSNCASHQLCADLDRYEFREICNYIFEDHKTIYTGHSLDLY